MARAVHSQVTPAYHAKSPLPRELRRPAGVRLAPAHGGGEYQAEALATRVAERVDASGSLAASDRQRRFCACEGDCPRCTSLSTDNHRAYGQVDSGPRLSVAPVGPEPFRRAGQAIHPEIRQAVERETGADLAPVRVHTDEAAACSAELLQARAYALGRHVVFGRDQYRPGTRDGDHLIAHELAHVVQQRGRTELVQRYPKGPGKLYPFVERKVDAALKKMQASTLPYETVAAEDILAGTIDIAFPDFVDTSVSPPKTVSAEFAMQLIQQWRERVKNVPGTPPLALEARIPGTSTPIAWDPSGSGAVTLQDGHFDSVIYLLSWMRSGEMATTLLHEALHIGKPLTLPEGDPGRSREIFLTELRSYYYAQHRNVADLATRFEKSVNDAEADVGYLAANAVPLSQVLAHREAWLAEAGAP